MANRNPKIENLKPWQPGQSGNPEGRTKGSRSKFSEAFLEDIYKDWQEHGPAALKTVREKDPSTYLRVCAGIIPKQFEISDQDGATFDRFIDTLSDTELDHLIKGIAKLGRENDQMADKTAKNSQRVH